MAPLPPPVSSPSSIYKRTEPTLTELTQTAPVIGPPVFNDPFTSEILQSKFQSHVDRGLFPFLRAQTGGGISALLNKEDPELSYNVVDLINKGMVMPDNIGAIQMQGKLDLNLEDNYTKSSLPQSNYAQPQQVKNYGNIY